MLFTDAQRTALDVPFTCASAAPLVAAGAQRALQQPEDVQSRQGDPRAVARLQPHGRRLRALEREEPHQVPGAAKGRNRALLPSLRGILRGEGCACQQEVAFQIEVFNVLFVKEIGGKFRVFCVQCARKGYIDDYVVLQQISFEELSTVFDQFQLHPVSHPPRRLLS